MDFSGNFSMDNFKRYSQVIEWGKIFVEDIFDNGLMQKKQRLFKTEQYENIQSDLKLGKRSQ